MGRIAMSRRRLSLAWIVLVLLAGAVSAQRDQVAVETASPVTVVTRESLEGRGTSLLLDLALTTVKVDEVRVKLPSDKTVKPAYVVPGWSVEQDGRNLRARGPGRTEMSARLELVNGRDKDYIGKKTDVQWFQGGRMISESTVTIGQLPAVTRSSNIEGILTLPAEVTPGQVFLAGTGDAYRRGTWQVTLNGGSGTRELPLWPISRFKTVEAEPPQPEWRVYFRDTALLPQVEALKSRQTGPIDPLVFAQPPDTSLTRVRFVDQFAETLVDAPLSIPAVTPPATCSRHIAAGSEFAFAGQAACLSGCFPDPGAAYGLMLDGTTELTPWAVSQTTAKVGIPPDTAAGPHTIRMPGTDTDITVGVLRVEGSIDQSKLWKGESTTLRLRVVGTDKPLPLVVLNRTPHVITVEGGEAQTVTTSGGADNVLTRSVQGIFRGNFQITYSLSAPGCGKEGGQGKKP
jgi:hypothetical protein